MAPSFTRVTTPAQIHTVVTLAVQIWSEYYPAIIGQPQVDYMLQHFQSASAIAAQIQQEQLQYYLIESDAEAVGYLAVQPREDNSLFISKLYVRGDKRGHGHARTAVEFAASLARILDLTKLSLTVNRHNTLALQVYTHLDFIQVGSVLGDIGGGFVMDDYRLEKSV